MQAQGMGLKATRHDNTGSASTSGGRMERFAINGIKLASKVTQFHIKQQMTKQ
jgi:hypothetical protein